MSNFGRVFASSSLHKFKSKLQPLFPNLCIVLCIYYIITATVAESIKINLNLFITWAGID